MKSRTKYGFTLIELIVVIAIIGILAATILAALGDARDKGIDAKIQTEMGAITKRAEIDQVEAFTYDTVCGTNGFSTSTHIVQLLESINSLSSSTAQCNSSPSSFAVSAPVSSGHWCVDSVGVRKEIASALTSGQLACP